MILVADIVFKKITCSLMKTIEKYGLLKEINTYTQF